MSEALAAIDQQQQYFNRDLSWLEFNRRVLAQASDTQEHRAQPLLERVKFLAIYASNLDEFFMKRVGLLRQRRGEDMRSNSTRRTPDGNTIAQTLAEIRQIVLAQQAEQANAWDADIRPSLAEAGIRLVDYHDLTADERAAADRYFMNTVFPILTPLAIDPGHRFPFISNLSVNLGVQLAERDRPGTRFARVKVPSVLPRLVSLDPTIGLPATRETRLLQLVDLIRHNLDDLFPGLDIARVLPFRITRAAGTDPNDADPEPIDEDDDLLDLVETQLKQRRFAVPTRVEVPPEPDRVILDFVLEELRLDQTDVYARGGPLDYADLFQVASMPRPELRFPPTTPVVPLQLREPDGGPVTDIFARVRERDVLVHHPYESFEDSVERFVAAAAEDPNVLAIKQTLYRTSKDSPFIASLIRAAEAGKQVACLVELRARFDEEKNVQFAKRLEDAGVHVAYGVVGLKTHCKCSLVVRREPAPDGGPFTVRSYCHIGTGNYHPGTALLYTDLGLLTCDPRITGDVVNLFNRLTGHAAEPRFDELLVAPQEMRSRFIALIDDEIASARAGRPARIVAKMNAMEDRALTRKLYEASQAGVEITLIVRGFCCLRPGAQGLSENIRVVSIVGRFLEHSRIFHFAAGHEDPAEGKYYFGSADWMYRNLSGRVEAMTPVHDAEARRRLARLIEINQRDRARAWELLPDGKYQPLPIPPDAPENGPERLGSFLALMKEHAMV